MAAWRIGLVVLLLMGCATPRDAAADTPLASAIALIDQDDFSAAFSAVAAMRGGAVGTYIEWRRLRASKGRFTDYQRFVKDHGDWPGIPLLMRQGEVSIPPGYDPRAVIAYFDIVPPQTGRGALRLGEALDVLGRQSEARAVAVDAWKMMSMSQAEQAEMIARYGKALKPHHWARLDAMIWDGHMDSAARMLPLVSAARRQLAQARIALRRNRDKVSKLIEAVPKSLSNDPGLAYDRFVWRSRRGRASGALEMVLARSDTRASLGRPQLWAKRRASLARDAMEAGDFAKAYELASMHQLRQDEDGFTELEWMAGYLALRKLDKAEAAVTHFRALRTAAITPITSGRVWYWLGRAHEAVGNEAKAKEAYGVGARYQTSFYGQLAAIAGGFPADPRLTGGPAASWKGADFLNSSVFKAGVLLHHAGERYEAGRFFAHLAETMTETEQAQLGAYLLNIERPNMALRVAKNAARMGRIVAAPYYPLHPVADRAKDVPPELVLAISRQESEFNPEVKSPAGALGLMQVMPTTARAVAGREGMEYSRSRLAEDWKYNADIAIAFLSGLIERYDGSYVLTAAAYNAGPSRAFRWMEENGDPREKDVDVVDWIEAIPFSETRNYVMRVMEALYVYRARLSGEVGPLTLARDLERGRR